MAEREGRGCVLAGSGLGFGAALAMVMSWTANKSVLWVLLHGLLGWIYVVWYLLTHHDWHWL
ncbi:MAG TPA: hypothetical protein PLY66_06260 [Acidobacteriota bacterium]|nr:hypothetical protein [Acidobacteriota bacterium]HOT00591.1 hypothetical protein [Acidobacteriota bacterium]HQF87276.1 hypothetical protein [Acidobacteriota bacterium]HQG91850.1 hypothetical protein [Acidobacteriota bacterium]HQK89062.1 hypothetical protein [Acidobacteriota bacterium]